MVNGAGAMLTEVWRTAVLGVWLGGMACAGLPIRRAIIGKWAKHGTRKMR